MTARARTRKKAAVEDARTELTAEEREAFKHVRFCAYCDGRSLEQPVPLLEQIKPGASRWLCWECAKRLQAQVSMLHQALLRAREHIARCEREKPLARLKRWWRSW